MGAFLFYTFEWIVVIISFVVFFLLCLWIYSTLLKASPLVIVPRAILDDIHKAFDIQKGSVVYALGCGDAKVLFSYAKKEGAPPAVALIGIDRNPFGLFLAHMNGWWYGKRARQKVQILRDDFLTHDLSNATHIITYLHPHLMNTLLSKFEKELKPGTKLVSIAYQFTLRRPTTEINLGRSTYQLARTLYVYEF
jgi:SAM-dependent methyltransferase